MYGGTYLDRSEVLHDILISFKMEKPKKKVFGNFRIEGDRLLYESEKKVCQTFWADNKDRKQVRDAVKRYLDKEKEGSFKFDSEESKKSILEDVKKNGHIRLTGCEIQERVIAKKIGDVFLGNSEMLNFPNRRRRREDVQVEMEKMGFKMIPFNVFADAKVSLDDLKIIDQSGSEDVLRKNGTEYKVDSKGLRIVKKGGGYIEIDKYEKTHFTGASLLKAGGKYFLFDIDRREIEHKRFNPFIVVLPRKADTIKEAYAMLKPKEVILAEKKKLKVLRQGEWFFIPTKERMPSMKLTEKEKLIILASHAYFRDDTHPGIDKKFKEYIDKKAEKLTKILYATKELQIQGRRSNKVQMCHENGKRAFCFGRITHEGREHEDLILKSWHLAIPNTAVKSFTVTGDID